MACVQQLPLQREEHGFAVNTTTGAPGGASMQDFADSLGSWESCFNEDDSTMNPSNFFPNSPPPGLEIMDPKVASSSFTSTYAAAASWPSDAMGAPGLVKRSSCHVEPWEDMEPMQIKGMLPCDAMGGGAVLEEPVKVNLATTDATKTHAPPAAVLAASIKLQQETLQAALTNYEVCLQIKKEQPKNTALTPTCSGCGTEDSGTGKFCMECGSKRVSVLAGTTKLDKPSVCAGMNQFEGELFQFEQLMDHLSSPTPTKILAGPTNSEPLARLDAEAVPTSRLRSSAAPFTSLDTSATPFQPLSAIATAYTVGQAPSIAGALCPQSYCGVGAQPWYGYPPADVQPCCSVNDNMTPEETVRTHLQLLQEVDPARVLLVRKINRLGFDSPDILKHHFSWYGAVEHILVSHSRMKWTQQSSTRVISSRVRPSGMGFIVMASPQAAAAVLAHGLEQVVAGATILVQRFEQKDAAKNPQDVDQQDDDGAKDA
jgi:hypothetical protein